MEYYDYRSFNEFPADGEEIEEGEEQDDQIILIRTAVRQEFSHLLKQSKEQAVLKAKEETNNKVEQLGEGQATDHQSDNTLQGPVNKTEKTKPSKKQEPAKEKVNDETEIKKQVKQAQTEQIKQLKKAIAKLKGKISLAKYRLKSNQGNKDTHEMNIEIATQEMNALQKRLKELSAKASS